MEQPLLYDDSDQEVMSISLSSNCSKGSLTSDEVTSTCETSSPSSYTIVPHDNDNDNADDGNSNSSYISMGLCGVTAFMILFEVFMVATFMSITWSSVVLRTYSDNKSNRYKEVTLEEYDLYSILNTFKESGSINTIWFFLVMLTFFTPIFKIVLQLLSLVTVYAGPPAHRLNAPLLVRRVDADSSLSSSSFNIEDDSSASSTQQEQSVGFGLCSTRSSVDWKNLKWKLLELQVYQISPLLSKLTGALIYALLLLLAVTTIDFNLHDENNTTFKVRVPLEGGSFTFFLASLASISVGNLLMHQMDRILEEVRLERGCGNAIHQTIAANECTDCDEYTEHLAQEHPLTSSLPQTSSQSRSSGDWRGKSEMLNFLAVAAFTTGIMVWFSPVVEVKYYGVDAVLMDETSTQYYLWGLFRYVYNSIDYRTDAVFMFSCLAVEVVVLPNAALALALALKECRTGSTTSARVALMLQYVRPCMNLESFVIGLLIFGSTAEYVFDYTFNDMYDICKVGELQQSTCLALSLSFMEGTWMLVIFSLSLVTFVTMVLPVPALSKYCNAQ